MTDPLYGPDKPCRRTPCIEALRAYRRARLTDMIHGDEADSPVLERQRQLIRDTDTGDHLGGAHLDPTDRDRYDGPVTLVKALPHTVRDAMRPLMMLAGCYTDRYHTDNTRSDTELRAAADLAVDTAGREIERLRQQVAHVQVDADHKIRDASRRALDCTDHGKVIADLERQVHHFDRSQHRTEKARLALLGEHQAIRDFIDAYDTGRGPDVDVPKLVEALRKMNKRASAAHARAWNN